MPMTIPQMRVAIDCDDAAIDLKKIVYDHLKKQGINITDLDYLGRNKADYPEIGFHLALEIQKRHYDRGILICGTGLGMAMIANKVEGVFAGTCHDAYSAERLKKSNDAQVLTMGSRVIGTELAKTIVDAWLRSEFQGGGSAPKVEKMRHLERDSFHRQD
jgi:ribose 5-phosphate isomerase B